MFSVISFGLSVLRSLPLFLGPPFLVRGSLCSVLGFATGLPLPRLPAVPVDPGVGLQSPPHFLQRCQRTTELPDLNLTLLHRT